MAQYKGFDWVIVFNAPKNHTAGCPKGKCPCPILDEETAFLILCKAYGSMLNPGKEIVYSIVQGEYKSNWHLQAFVQFDTEWNKRDVEQYMREISGGLEAYVQKRVGTPQQASDYCLPNKIESGDKGITWELFPMGTHGTIETIDRHRVAAVREAIKDSSKHPCAPEYVWGKRRRCAIHAPLTICGCEEITDHRQFIDYVQCICRKCGDIIEEIPE